MTKIRTVKTLEAATTSINKFRGELDDSLELQAVMGYARAWYALRDTDGEWTFAPSKFAGYENMTGDVYMNSYKSMNGRETERVLAEWFTVVDAAHPLHVILHTKLKVYLDWYDKSPSIAARICIPDSLYENELMDDDDIRERKIADLLIAVGRSLRASERKRVAATI